MVAAFAVAVVVFSSAIFGASLKDEFLGHEDPHWHKPKEPSLAAQA